MSGLNGKYVKTYAPGSSEHLAIKKHDEVVAAYNALAAKFNALLAKLDADVVGGADYVTVIGAASADVKTASKELLPSPKKEDI